MMRIPLPREANHMIKRLAAHGFKAYAVGGCVRDFVMGYTPSDYDITTNALPEQTARIFADAKVIETGIRHGTVTVILNGFKAEITTFRIDGSYTDSRHPDRVMFCPDLKEDLKRRDFTMNALAYNEAEGFMDFFGGIDDINNKTIRCVGDAEQRFTEDALRILRGLRFSSVLGFDIEESTRKAIYTKYRLLANISAERIFEELKKLICGKNVYTVLTEFRDIFCFLLPALAGVTNDEYHSAAELVSKAPWELKLTALFYFCGADGARTMLRRLKSDNRTVYKVCTALEVCTEPMTAERTHALRLLNKYGSEPMQDALALMLLLPEASVQVKTLKDVVEDILTSKECYKISQLAVNGSDLIQMGITDGKQIGTILNTLLDHVMKDKAPNTTEHLLQLVKNSDIKR